MTIPDYEFYRNEFHGRAIQAADDFSYFAERAGDELARFVRMLPSVAQNDYSRCICAVADIKAQTASTSRNGRAVQSESVNGYYSVTYGAAQSESKQISKAVSTYLSRWICGPVRVRE